MIMNTTLYDFSMNDINGTPTEMSMYKGRVVLIVNVASFCGYTKQYSALEKLHRSHNEKGLVILGFPANDFGAQEPGTEDEIKEFCTTKYDVTFPLFSKVTVKGPETTPLFAWLIGGGGNAEISGKIRWNFEKFLVGRDGMVVSRYSSTVDPLSQPLLQDVETALAK